MRLIDLDEDRARDAAIDGLWQALMLAGALEAVPMSVEFLSYEAPSPTTGCWWRCGSRERVQRNSAAS